MNRTIVFCILLVEAILCLERRGAADDAVQLHAVLGGVSTIHSGRGEGLYHFHNRKNGVRYEMEFDVTFDSKRFRLDLHPRKIAGTTHEDDRRVVISDGSGLFATRYSQSIMPAGCETDAWPDRPGAWSMATGGFLFDFREWYEVFDITNRLDQPDLKVTKLPNGDFECRYTKGKRECLIQVAADAGYNLVECVWRPIGATNKPAGWKVVWSESEDGWWIRKMEHWVQGTATDTIAEVTLSRFEMNPRFDNDLFTFGSLGPCENSRVIDRRPDAQQFAYRYTTASAVQARMDTMIDQLEELPPNTPPVEKASPGSVRRVWAAALAIACVVFALVGGYLYRKEH